MNESGGEMRIGMHFDGVDEVKRIVGGDERLRIPDRTGEVDILRISHQLQIHNRVSNCSILGELVERIHASPK